MTHTKGANKMNKEKLIAFLNRTAVIVPHADEESMRVDHVLDNEVYCTGEESGEQYAIGLDEFDPNDYMFYELKLIELGE